MIDKLNWLIPIDDKDTTALVNKLNEVIDTLNGLDTQGPVHYSRENELTLTLIDQAVAAEKERIIERVKAYEDESLEGRAYVNAFISIVRGEE